MPRIHKLSLHEAQKIAAGEVVERPANVVKELLENSLDAGATSIALYLEDAGKELIRIVDNGHGMSSQDARLCIEQHATSKITCVDDLKTIGTFGFRGEALASICAVSDVTLVTKEADAVEGIQLHIKAGTITKETSIACTTGTDITIRSLFYNVPARKKFLKKRETELNQINQMLHAFCLQHRHIHFKCFHDGRQFFNHPPTDSLITRFAQLWDHTLAAHMISFSAQDEKKKITLTGALSNHQHMRYDRSSLFIFINKRWIKNYALSKAILKGYMNVLVPARYPTVCIDITIPTELVDINIHPRKEEVQFLHPHIVENLVTSTIKKHLEEHLSLQLKKPITFSATPTFIPPFEHTSPQYNHGGHQKLPPKQSLDFSDALDMPVFPNYESPLPTKHQPTPAVSSEETMQGNIPQNASSVELMHDSYRILGQYHKTYILLEQDEGLFLIDQHAAHERILYELFSQRFEHVATVQLIFPQTISLSHQDMELITPHLPLFERNGIKITVEAATQLQVNAIPVHLKDTSLHDLVHQVVGWIIEYATLDTQTFTKTINEKLQAQMACKAAVKAGDILTIEHMQQLVDTLFITNNRFTCPHGRPTGWMLSLNDIERKFKRKL